MTPEEEKEPQEPDVEEPELPPPEEPEEVPSEEIIPGEELAAEPSDEAISEEEPLGVEPEEEWIEEFEAEELEPEEPRKPKKRRHIAGPVIAVIVILFLIIWTFWSPAVTTVAGDTYITSPAYANLGSYTFDSDVRIAADIVDAGRVVWGVSISGDANATAGVETVFRITVSKVSEGTSNFFFRGTSISLSEATLFFDNGTYFGTMSDYTKTRFGPTANIRVTFDEPGEHELVGYVRFTVYEVMRIGFLPSQEVEITDIFFDSPILVTR